MFGIVENSLTGSKKITHFVQIRSSEELADLFEYDYVKIKKKSAVMALRESTISSYCKLQLLDKASDHNLTKFVTHYNSQVRKTLILTGKQQVYF